MDKTMRKLQLGILLCCLPMMLLAQKAKETKPWKTTYQGDISALARFYWNDLPDSYNSQEELWTSQRVKFTKGSNWTILGDVRGTANSQHLRRTRVWLNEAYISYRKKNWFVKIGKQTIKWGNMTGWSAMDLVNRYDYYDVLETEEEQLGLWGLELRLSQKSNQFRLRILPGQNRSRLHLEDNRWIVLPQEVPHPGIAEEMIPLQQLGTSDTLSRRLPQIGMDYAAEIGRFSTRISGFIGQNDIPQAHIRTMGLQTDHVPYQLDLWYHPIAIASIHLSTYLGDWNVWGEGAYVSSRRFASGDDRLSDDNYGFASLGVDRLWFFEDPEKQLRLLFQYVQSFSNNLGTYAPTEIDHVFRSTFILDLDYRFNYKWNASLRTVADWKTNGYYIQPDLQYRPNDQWQIHLRSDILTGKETGFFGFFEANSRISVHSKFYIQ